MKTLRGGSAGDDRVHVRRQLRESALLTRPRAPGSDCGGASGLGERERRRRGTAVPRRPAQPGEAARFTGRSFAGARPDPPDDRRPRRDVGPGRNPRFQGCQWAPKMAHGAPVPVEGAERSERGPGTLLLERHQPDPAVHESGQPVDPVQNRLQLHASLSSGRGWRRPPHCCCLGFGAQLNAAHSVFRKTRLTPCPSYPA